MQLFSVCYKTVVARILVVIASLATATAFATTPLNILWISCEDMSPNIGPYGDNLAKTPNLDRFAHSACTFTRAFSTSPVCSPSRSTIITGVYASTLGTQHHRSKIDLPPGVKTFTSYLRDAGYYCTNSVKTDYNFDVPKDAWDENSKDAHWRNRPRADQPFFSVFNFTTTHESKFMLSDEEFEDVVKDVKPADRMDPAKVSLPPYIPDTPITRKDRARYYDMIAQMDIEAGRILQELIDDGLTSNTVVVYFSDHGEGLPRGKRWLYDSGLHVPLVVRWPRVTLAGSRSEELASLMDLAPTMLSIAGVNRPDYMQGRVIVGADKQPEPKFLFATRDRMDEVHDMSRSVRDSRFKYIKNFYPERPYDLPIKYLEGSPTQKELRRLDSEGSLTGAAALYFQDKKPAEELFDTQNDPYELKNLASDPAHADRLATMRQELEAWQKRTGDKGLEPEPETQQGKGKKGGKKKNS